MAGIRATLSEVLTPEVYPGMIDRATEWTAGFRRRSTSSAPPGRSPSWAVAPSTASGRSAPRDGREAADADDFELQQYLHLHALNRGVLMTPFHNMALMCPATTSADVDRHTVAFREAVASLYG